MSSSPLSARLAPRRGRGAGSSELGSGLRVKLRPLCLGFFPLGQSTRMISCAGLLLGAPNHRGTQPSSSCTRRGETQGPDGGPGRGATPRREGETDTEGAVMGCRDAGPGPTIRGYYQMWGWPSGFGLGSMAQEQRFMIHGSRAALHDPWLESSAS